MIKKYMLVVRKDNETGELGLIVEGTKLIQYPMAATEGLLIAHDLIEHPNGVEEIGSIGDELEALGGVIFTRAQWGDMSRDGRGAMFTPEQNVASDIVNLGRIYFSCVPMRVKIPKRLYKSDGDECIQDCIDESRQDLFNEMDGEVTMSQVLEYLVIVRKLMNRGYSKLNRKYKDNKVKANTLFWNIADAVDSIINYIDYEYQQFELIIKDEYTVSCNEYYEEEYLEEMT